MKSLLRCLGACALVVGCTKPQGSAPETPGATSEGAEAPAGATGAPDFDALAAREASGLSEQSVSGPEKRFTVKVRAAGSPKVSREANASMVEIPIGTGEVMRCEVFDGDIDTGGTIGAVLADATKKVQIQRVAPWAIEIVDEAPVTFVHAVYTIASPKGKAVGELKLALHSAAGHPVFCSHDELGYEKTFLEGVKTFCGSIRHSGKMPPKPTFIEVQIAKLGGVPVGFSKSTVEGTGEDRKYSDTTTMLMPISGSELRVEDGYSVQRVGPDDLLSGGVWVSASAGHVDLNLQLERTKGGSYHYSGEVQGKKIQGDFVTKDKKGLPSGLVIARQLAAKAKGKGAYSIEVAGYHPEIDPTKPVPQQYSRNKDDAPSVIRGKLGNITLTGTLDEDGLTKNAEIPVGALSMALERAFIRGKPWER